jgi:3-oxo-5alpha-steroid 4-dehydrogenase
LLHAPVRRLVLDPEGRVIGVEVNPIAPDAQQRHDELYKVVDPWKPFNAAQAEAAIAECRALEAVQTERRLIRAQRGVVLASGGFVYNLALLHQHRPLLGQLHSALLRLGSMGCDGSGIALGQSAGGATGLMDRFFLGRPLAPPEAFIYGVLVNSEGHRFINEDAYQSLFGDELAEQSHNGRAYLVLDARHFWKGVWQSLFPGKGLFRLWGAPALLNIVLGGTRRGRTLAALARRARIDAAALESTIADYNRLADTGAADAFGKSPDKLVPLTKGPYYAVNCSLGNPCGPTFAFSLGGLLVDNDSGLVKRSDGSLIAGLYAAGRSAVGLCSLGYMTGLAIADTVFSGRRAARHAAQTVLSDTD